MEFPLKATVPYIVDLIQDKAKSGITDIAVDYITAFPILIGVSLGVYAFASMFSKSFAKLWVMFNFAYGFIIVLF